MKSSFSLSLWQMFPSPALTYDCSQVSLSLKFSSYCFSLHYLSVCLRFSFIWQLKSYLPTSHTQLMLRSLQRHHHLTFLQVTLNPACTLALTSDSQFTLSPTLPTNHSPTMFLSENYSLLHPCLQSPGLVSLSSLLSFVGKTLKHLLSIFVIFLVNLKAEVITSVYVR